MFASSLPLWVLWCLKSPDQEPWRGMISNFIQNHITEDIPIDVLPPWAEVLSFYDPCPLGTSVSRASGLPFLPLCSLSYVVSLCRERQTFQRCVCYPYHHPKLSLGKTRWSNGRHPLWCPVVAQLKNSLVHGFFPDAGSCFGVFGLFTSICDYFSFRSPELL